jgi:hypothetical protein
MTASVVIGAAGLAVIALAATPWAYFAGWLLVGIAGYQQLPVSALPEVDYGVFIDGNVGPYLHHFFDSPKYFQR